MLYDLNLTLDWVAKVKAPGSKGELKPIIIASEAAANKTSLSETPPLAAWIIVILESSEFKLSREVLTGSKVPWTSVFITKLTDLILLDSIPEWISESW